ncbi:hypothetical protein SAMN05216188_10590 [Lentzea xinjiangensis]|uniref:DUF3558 domain-containing protein n=1 Tax=Lentzea xinjiangensis TaxID=402600 RepID=A0A1H9IV27_9PSEU|nr:hypothetical protein [Lentzea xinjiangensis]SEQ78434.1 hypothetical protein SAMN05216188_10590 [Lentzea xinjiangensis]
MRLTLLAAASLLAACTSAPQAAPAQAPQAPTTVEQPAGTGPNCANANSSVVGKALGLRLQGQRETVEKAVTTCTYVGPGMPVEVRFTTGATAAAFARARPAAAKAIANFHDEAYETTAGGSETTQHTVVARKGKTQIEVVSPAGVEPSKKLIDDLFGRI